MLEELHARLAGVIVECLDFGDFIRRYDAPGALFYLDPPYWGCEDDYGRALFAPDDFARLADQLAGLQGRFLLSVNDVPEIRELFGTFNLQTVETTYGISRQAAAKAAPRRELLVSGR